jgi:hypothetical protein
VSLRLKPLPSRLNQLCDGPTSCQDDTPTMCDCQGIRLRVPQVNNHAITRNAGYRSRGYLQLESRWTARRLNISLHGLQSLAISYAADYALYGTTLSALIGILMQSSRQPASQPQQQNPMPGAHMGTPGGMATNVTVARDVVQIAFFVVVATVTVLTYIKAKRTVLQPIRTEVFKEQIKVFAEILGYFTGKNEVELAGDAGIEEVWRANSFALLDDYGRLFFELDIDSETRPYSRKQCPVAVFTREAAAKNLALADGHTQGEPRSTPGPRPDPRTRAAIWTQHKHGMIALPKKYVEYVARLERLIDSPLVPKRLAELVQDYLGTLEKNVMLSAEVLTEAASEMPEKYPTAEALNSASTDWLRHRLHRRSVSLEDKARPINTFLRDYFTSDTLLSD